MPGERGSTKPVAGTVFFILLALADRARYGLDILEEIDVHTAGAIRMGPGTLYNAIGRMLDEGLIEEAEAPDVTDPSEVDPRRKYYGITPQGRTVLEEEASRLAAVVDAARLKAVLPQR
jgi:DNA-binding PadR family transcriptional regulator